VLPAPPAPPKNPFVDDGDKSDVPSLVSSYNHDDDLTDSLLQHMRRRRQRCSHSSRDACTTPVRSRLEDYNGDDEAPPLGLGSDMEQVDEVESNHEPLALIEDSDVVAQAIKYNSCLF
jgi:hypothetical protein